MRKGAGQKAHFNEPYGLKLGEFAVITRWQELGLEPHTLVEFPGSRVYGIFCDLCEVETSPRSEFT